MISSEAALETSVCKPLGIPLKIVLVQGTARMDSLTVREKERLEHLHSVPRRDCWLRGRAALKCLLSYFGEDDDTSRIHFPHCRFSLTHSGDYAVAVGTRGTCLRGIGVDLEIKRQVNPRAARFFLTPEEQTWPLDFAEPLRSRELLRLWTIKEALFKSHPFNQKLGLLDFRLADSRQVYGKALGGPWASDEMFYSSIIFGPEILSLAIFPRETCTHD